MLPDPIRGRAGEKGRLIVQIPYFPDHVAKIRTVPGPCRHAQERYWTVPQGQETIGQLLGLFPGKPVEVDPVLGAGQTPNNGKSTSAVLDSVLTELRTGLQARHYSRKTEQAYGHWLARFTHFHHGRPPAEMGEPEINAFLTHLAIKAKVSASTQNQALSAIRFLYRHVLGREVGDPGEVIRARRPKRLPVVLTREEVKAVLFHLSGDKWLMASLMYGAGLRLMECLRLRVQDIDFSRKEILVRDGKGAKDRVTMLPESLTAPLREHLTRVKAVHEQDVADGWGRVAMPEALDRKYPNAPKEWLWQWVFPPREPLGTCQDRGGGPSSCP